MQRLQTLGHDAGLFEEVLRGSELLSLIFLLLFTLQLRHHDTEKHHLKTATTVVIPFDQIRHDDEHYGRYDHIENDREDQMLGVPELDGRKEIHDRSIAKLRS